MTGVAEKRRRPPRPEGGVRGRERGGMLVCGGHKGAG